MRSNTFILVEMNCHKLTFDNQKIRHHGSIDKEKLVDEDEQASAMAKWHHHEILIGLDSHHFQLGVEGCGVHNDSERLGCEIKFIHFGHTSDLLDIFFMR